MLDCIFLPSQMCDFSTSNASMRHLEAWVISRAPTKTRRKEAKSVRIWAHASRSKEKSSEIYIRTMSQLVHWKVTLAESQPQSIHAQQQPAAKQKEFIQESQHWENDETRGRPQHFL
jgi:ADP-ribosylglycohydrolase